ncbi:hypothetical protein JCM6882_008351 [Rhodosporidiobolus microsporus]
MPPTDSALDPPLPTAPPPDYSIAIASPLLPSHAPGPSTSSASAFAAHPAFQHAHSNLNLPSSFFLLRNRAQGKALDLRGHKTYEGAEFGVHPIKQPQLKGLSLQHSGNNQLFFLDWDGHLNSAAASRAVEVVDDRLTLAFPHPIMSIPSSLSHPLPLFRLDPSTSTLHVLFSCDPLHRGPTAPADWRDEDYVVEVLPLKQKRKRPGAGGVEEALFGGKAPNQLLSELGTKAGGVLSGIGGFFGGPKSGPSSPNPSRFGFPSPELPLPPPPVPEKTPSVPASPRQPAASSSSARSPPLPSPPPPPRAEDPSSDPSPDSDSESDSDPSGHRPVRIVRLPRGWREKFPADALRASPSTSFGVTQWPAGSGDGTPEGRRREREVRRWRRRMWEAVPVTVQPVPVGGSGEDTRRGLGELLGADDSGSDSSDEGDGEDEYATEEEDAAYLSSLRRLSFARGGGPSGDDPTASQTPGALFSSTLSSAAQHAQTHATSAATALSGILSSVTSFAGRERDRGRDADRDASQSPPLPDLPDFRLRTSSRASREEGGGEGGAGDGLVGGEADAAELGREAIEGLGLGGVETGGKEEREVAETPVPVRKKGHASPAQEEAATAVGAAKEGGGAAADKVVEGSAAVPLPVEAGDGLAEGEASVEAEGEAPVEAEGKGKGKEP